MARPVSLGALKVARVYAGAATWSATLASAVVLLLASPSTRIPHAVTSASVVALVAMLAMFFHLVALSRRTGGFRARELRDLPYHGILAIASGGAIVAGLSLALPALRGASLHRVGAASVAVSVPLLALLVWTRLRGHSRRIWADGVVVRGPVPRSSVAAEAPLLVALAAVALVTSTLFVGVVSDGVGWLPLIAAFVSLPAVAVVARRARKLDRDLRGAMKRVEWMNATATPVGDLPSTRFRTREGRALVDRLLSLVVAHDALRREEAHARESLAEARRLKTRFMAYMSHDLRSPLNAILGFADLVASDVEPLNPDQRESLDTVRRAARELLRLVNEIVDSARLESGSIRMRPEFIPVAGLLSESVGGARLALERAGGEVGTELQPGLPAVFVDPYRMRQAIGGILVHLAQSGEPGSLIRIRAAREEGPPGPASQVRLFFDAPGAEPPEDPAEVFLPFRWGRRSASGRSGGLGVGLSLAQGLVAAASGAIWFQPPHAIVVALPTEKKVFAPPRHHRRAGGGLVASRRER